MCQPVKSDLMGLTVQTAVAGCRASSRLASRQGFLATASISRARVFRPLEANAIRGSAHSGSPCSRAPSSDPLGGLIQCSPLDGHPISCAGMAAPHPEGEVSPAAGLASAPGPDPHVPDFYPGG